VKGWCAIGIIEFIVLAVVLGLIAWSVTTYIPMPPAVKAIIIIAVCAMLVLVLMRAMGILNYDPAIPRIDNR